MNSLAGLVVQEASRCVEMRRNAPKCAQVARKAVAFVNYPNATASQCASPINQS